MTANQFKNLLVFLLVITNEDAVDCILEHHPEYLVEKYNKYLGAPLPDDEAWRHGAHALLETCFDAYCAKWDVDNREWWNQLELVTDR